jgi:predicted RNase H-like nuclease (RuvC/YqgF family)
MIFGRNPDREKREATAERNKFILKLQSQIEKLKAHNKVLERALVALDKDYETLLKEHGTTVDEAWQKYCEETMPQKTAHFYPLSGAMYTIFVTGWNAALKEKK